MNADVAQQVVDDFAQALRVASDEGGFFGVQSQWSRRIDGLRVGHSVVRHRREVDCAEVQRALLVESGERSMSSTSPEIRRLSASMRGRGSHRGCHRDHTITMLLEDTHMLCSDGLINLHPDPLAQLARAPDDARFGSPAQVIARLLRHRTVVEDREDLIQVVVRRAPTTPRPDAAPAEARNA